MPWHAKHFPTENLSIAIGATIDIFHHKKLNFASAFGFFSSGTDKGSSEARSKNFHSNLQ